MPSKRMNVPPPKRFHLDRRAASIAASSAGDDDELLTTQEEAAWLQVSVQWLEIGRSKGYGPPYERLGPKTIRYQRGKTRKWLGQRSHYSTSEYRDELEPLEVGRG